MSFYATVNGTRATHMLIRIPYAGIWLATCEFDEGPVMSGKATVVLGPATYVGVVAQDYVGVYAVQTRARIVGGAGGWSKTLPAKHYHSDAGVNASTVVTDVARLAGETLGAMSYPIPKLGTDFVSESGPGSRVLEQVFGSRFPWWVAADGTTQSGQRPAVEVAGKYETMNYDPRTKVATIALEDPAILQIGSVLRDKKMAVPLVVRELEFDVQPGSLRVMAWGRDLTS
jgi:hypothetical protein